jgi:hypothetical protein
LALTSNPETRACPEVGFSKVVSIIMVVLLPAPFGPKNPKISPSFTLKEMSSTAFRSPKDFDRDFVSIEYNTLIGNFNYKLLSVFVCSILKKNLKADRIFFHMKGLCQVCHCSNVEVTVNDGIPVCTECSKKDNS